MFDIAKMTTAELCAFVSSHLLADDIAVVLVGGACVTIYSDNKYQTTDLDFVQRYDVKRRNLAASLAKIGFSEKNRYFKHPDTAFFLEFPSGPISVGNEPVHEFAQLETEFGNLVLLTATDICKDRLAVLYRFWR